MLSVPPDGLIVQETVPLILPLGGLLLLIVACCLMLVLGLVWKRKHLIGTTLTGPWWWTLTVIVVIGATEVVLAVSQADTVTADAWRFAVGVGAFCPLMSLIGAKRPQDRAWHFIVLSLWGMLALPALEGLVLRPGQPLAIIDARAWFLIGLIGLNVLVLLPTRRWLAALLVGAGQTWLLWSYLPWVEGETSAARVAAACLLWVLALVVVALQRPRVGLAPLDLLWLDFRDAFGALWAARVLERVNAAAVMYHWPFRLGWSGFHAADNPLLPAEITPEQAGEVRQTLVNLLRRFVSNAWIEKRLQGVDVKESGS